jgi:hypothetical protein
MEAFKSDLGLIKNMYPDELELGTDFIRFIVQPSAEYGVHTMFQFDLLVRFTPSVKIVLENPRGLDETEIINFKRLIKTTVCDLQSEGTDCLLFALITAMRQALTDYSD